MRQILNSTEIHNILKKSDLLRKKMNQLPVKRSFISPQLPEGAPLTNYKVYYPDEHTLEDLRWEN